MNNFYRYPATYSSSAYMMPGLITIGYTEYNLINDICNYFGISIEELKKNSRERKYCESRQICIYYIKKMFPKLTIKHIGKLFNKTHATAIHSIKAVENAIVTDNFYKKKILEIGRIIDNHIIKL